MEKPRTVVRDVGALWAISAGVIGFLAIVGWFHDYGNPTIWLVCWALLAVGPTFWLVLASYFADRGQSD